MEQSNPVDITTLFGSLVFNDGVMKEKLSDEVYFALKDTMLKGSSLDPTIADAVAHAMMEWALEKGATHFTHWFQPMTGITAEKHDSFISPLPGGKAIMEFSGKELIKGESDASSFPSGGLRATFEARGYTAWDPSSYAFIKGKTLCIPTIFCSYSGETLDKKTPLLRSMEALNTEAVRLLNIIGETDVTHVTTTVGAEQEYFLVDRKLSYKRTDILFADRTLFGAMPPKGQELEDHYFGAIKPKIQGFMDDLNLELWKLGIYAKTEHNEAAPSQHEIAPIFENTNIAVDHNQLTMEVIKDVARRHDLSCLLHEKPFKGINGSGKHNNWSMQTDTGINLLSAGKHPAQNLRFLLILTAVIKAVDDYQDLLRVACATAGNDHRLGASEAPPAIISIFLGDELTNILEAMEHGETYSDKAPQPMEMGVNILPAMNKDSADRNRTSPFAFTGNKFEFRMVGSSLSVAEPNIVINTIVAEVFRQFADELEGATDMETAIKDLIARTFHEHKRIVFNGNNYSDEWVEEAARRGLLNLRTSVDAIPYYVDLKNVQLFTKHNVFTQAELHSRCEILLDNYCKVLHIEALTMIEMARKEIYPAVIKYLTDTATSANAIKGFLPNADCTLQERLVSKISTLSAQLYQHTEALEQIVQNSIPYEVNIQGYAIYYRDNVLPAMESLREVADQLEILVGKDYWPFPTYGDLLFKI